MNRSGDHLVGARCNNTNDGNALEIESEASHLKHYGLVESMQFTQCNMMLESHSLRWKPIDHLASIANRIRCKFKHKELENNEKLKKSA